MICRNDCALPDQSPRLSRNIAYTLRLHVAYQNSHCHYYQLLVVWRRSHCVRIDIAVASKANATFSTPNNNDNTVLVRTYGCDSIPPGKTAAALPFDRMTRKPLSMHDRCERGSALPPINWQLAKPKTTRETCTRPLTSRCCHSWGSGCGDLATGLNPKSYPKQTGQATGCYQSALSKRAEVAANTVQPLQRCPISQTQTLNPNPNPKTP